MLMQQERLFISTDVAEQKKSRKKNIVNNLTDVYVCNYYHMI